MNHRVKTPASDNMNTRIAELKLGDALFEIRKGLSATLRQAESGSSVLIGPAYAALAALNGLHPDRAPEEQRSVVLYRLQQAWYETPPQGGEPEKTKARREALWEGFRRVPTEKPRRAVAPRAATAGGMTAAHIIKKGLLEGQATDEIVKVVKIASPESKCDAKTVAYYRHQLRKKGELKK